MASASLLRVREFLSAVTLPHSRAVAGSCARMHPRGALLHGSASSGKTGIAASKQWEVELTAMPALSHPNQATDSLATSPWSGASRGLMFLLLKWFQIDSLTSYTAVTHWDFVTNPLTPWLCSGFAAWTRGGFVPDVSPFWSFAKV